LTFKQETLNYDALWTQVGVLLPVCASSGVAREQRVAVFLDKRIETVAAIFGAGRGCRFRTGESAAASAQVGHILRDCDVRVLVTSPERLALMRDELASCPTSRDVVLVGARIEEGEPAAHYRVHGWEQLRGSEHEAPTPR
jgi:long-subunit acyl-CoA synthetase (AMP-forming)